VLYCQIDTLGWLRKTFCVSLMCLSCVICILTQIPARVVFYFNSCLRFFAWLIDPANGQKLIRQTEFCECHEWKQTHINICSYWHIHCHSVCVCVCVRTLPYASCLCVCVCECGEISNWPTFMLDTHTHTHAHTLARSHIHTRSQIGKWKKSALTLAEAAYVSPISEDRRNIRNRI